MPTLEYIEDYEVAFRNFQKKGMAALRDKPTNEVVQRLKEREKTLLRPKPSAQELFGWQKIVYDKLPSGEFRTSDLYAFQSDFRQRYPTNKNVKAKIRQILQQLRDLKLIDHPATNRWRSR